MALELAYAAHSSKVFTLSSPGVFSLTSSARIGSACIHLRSQAVAMAWNATSAGQWRLAAFPDGRENPRCRRDSDVPNLWPK